MIIPKTNNQEKYNPGKKNQKNDNSEQDKRHFRKGLLNKYSCGKEESEKGQF